MNEIRPFSIQRKNSIDKTLEICYYKIQCLICGKKFTTKRMKPKDEIFICVKCQCEIDHSEIEEQGG